MAARSVSHCTEAMPGSGVFTGPAGGVITVANAHVPEVQAFCAEWDMTVTASASRDARYAVLVVQGRQLPVLGLTEITSMYRR
jgi:hypothetical protein